MPGCHSSCHTNIRIRPHRTKQHAVVRELFSPPPAVIRGRGSVECQWRGVGVGTIIADRRGLNDRNRPCKISRSTARRLLMVPTRPAGRPRRAAEPPRQIGRIGCQLGVSSSTELRMSAPTTNFLMHGFLSPAAMPLYIVVECVTPPKLSARFHPEIFNALRIDGVFNGSIRRK